MKIDFPGFKPGSFPAIGLQAKMAGSLPAPSPDKIRIK